MDIGLHKRVNIALTGPMEPPKRVFKLVDEIQAALIQAI